MKWSCGRCRHFSRVRHSDRFFTNETRTVRVADPTETRMKRFTLVATFVMLVVLSAGAIARAEDQKDSDVQKERQQAIRRLSLDIAGREPTEEEVRDLAGDGSADAYRKAIDRLYSEQRDKWVRLKL